MIEGQLANGAPAAVAKWAYIVDDDEDFRNSVVALLTANGWQVEAFDAPRSFRARAPLLEPGLLLLDLNMPGSTGLELLESDLGELDRHAVIMVTGAGAIETAVRTMKAGAIDFLQKPFAASDLLRKLDALAATLAETIGAKALALEANQKIRRLSPRERDVLERLLGGASNKLIGRALDLSPRTVEMHRAKMLQRLGVDTTAEALALARRAGLRPVEVA